MAASGVNVLNIDDSASPAPPVGRYTYLVSASSVQRLWAAGITYSGMGQVVLKGSDTASNYVITSSTVAAPVSIQGGAADDVFAFMGGASVSGTIDGGGGHNTLDYSNYGRGVIVNLSGGTATGVIGGIANIQNVLAAAGYNDKLVGDAGNNILVGNAGNDLIESLGGRDVMIVGADGDQLRGGSGDQLIINGTTRYDGNVEALDAILAEWQRTDEEYAVRVDHLSKGVGSGGFRLVLNQTVFDDRAFDSLTLGPGETGTGWASRTSSKTKSSMACQLRRPANPRVSWIPRTDRSRGALAVDRPKFSVAEGSVTRA